MPNTLTAISLYKITLITALLSWLLDRTGAMQRLPRVEIFGDGGFWLIHSLLFVAVWLLIGFLERLFGVGKWLRALRSSHGTAAFLDVLLLLAALVCWVVAFGAATLSPYQIALTVLLPAAAFQSLLSGREPSRALAADVGLPLTAAAGDVTGAPPGALAAAPPDPAATAVPGDAFNPTSVDLTALTEILPAAALHGPAADDAAGGVVVIDAADAQPPPPAPDKQPPPTVADTVRLDLP